MFVLPGKPMIILPAPEAVNGYRNLQSQECNEKGLPQEPESPQKF